MLFKSLVAAAAVFSAASAVAVVERAATTDPALAPLANVPAACHATCDPILAGLQNVDPSNLSTLSAVCTTDVQKGFLACINCFEKESPQTFTPELLTALQGSVDQLGTGCLLIGSPLSSLTVPTPTGGAASGGASATGNATATPAPTGSSAAPSAAGSSSSRTGGADRAVVLSGGVAGLLGSAALLVAML